MKKDNSNLFLLKAQSVLAFWAEIKTASIYFPVEREYLVSRCIYHLLFWSNNNQITGQAKRGMDGNAQRQRVLGGE